MVSRLETDAFMGHRCLFRHADGEKKPSVRSRKEGTQGAVAILRSKVVNLKNSGPMNSNLEASDGGVGSLLSAVRLVSYDPLFTALELSVFKPWLVRPANESNCTVLVCSSHVKRVLMELSLLNPWLVRPANESGFSVTACSSVCFDQERLC